MEKRDGFYELEWWGWVFRYREGVMEVSPVGARRWRPLAEVTLDRPADAELETALASLERHPQ